MVESMDYQKEVDASYFEAQSSARDRYSRRKPDSSRHMIFTTAVKPKKVQNLATQSRSISKLDGQHAQDMHRKSTKALRTDLENLCTFVESPNSITQQYDLR
jgi:hypothetical protein